jgi:hypothetical protein
VPPSADFHSIVVLSSRRGYYTTVVYCSASDRIDFDKTVVA